MKKYITTTLPYINTERPHVGFTFEVCIADIISDYFRYKFGNDNVFLNLGIDEHGQKIYQKSIEEGFDNPQDYCDKMAISWKSFLEEFQINYNNFYRTTDIKHKENVLRYYHDIESILYKKTYNGKYCVGCESFKTDKEVEDNKCIIHKSDLTDIQEENTFFPLHKFSHLIKDILVNKSLSQELKNILQDDFDLSITRKNVKWGIELNDDETIYVWAEALMNYVLSIKYYEDPEYFKSFWDNSLQICGKDNLKFQAYILQALLLANNIPQTKELLVHGTILDENGFKMSKSLGNVIDPIQQKEKFGLSPVKYYLTFGLSLFDDSKYSEKDLINIWNSDIVKGFGNLISRTLHLIDIKNIEPNEESLTIDFQNYLKMIEYNIEDSFEKYDFNNVRNLLNQSISKINKKYEVERPFDKECILYSEILNEIYCELKLLSKYYSLILKEYKNDIEKAFVDNKKIILFKSL